MNGNNDISNKPNIGYRYHLVYIRSSELAECLGNESTGCCHIYDDNGMMGSEKYGSYNHGMETESEEIKKQIKQLPFTKIVKIGLFEVKKIWDNKSVFSVHGVPIFYDKIIFDTQTNKWQNELDKNIKDYKWQDRIDEEIKQFNEKEELLSKYPNDTYVKCLFNYNEYKDDRQEFIRLGGEYDKIKRSWYIPKGIDNSKFEKLLKKEQDKRNKIKQNKINKKELLLKYPNDTYIKCPFNDKEEVKKLGGLWDKDKKSWYIPKGIDNSKFEKWLVKQ